MKTPLSLGYRFPAEWEPQSAVMFSWPRPEGISFPDRYHTIAEQLGAIIRTIADRQHVYINVPNGNYEKIVTGVLRKANVKLKRVRIFHIPTNEAWARDHGPACLVHSKSGKPAIVDWGFNAFDSDDAVPTRFAKVAKVKTLFNPGVIMEGGAVDFNGAGTVLTTTDCLLNKNRNPDLNKSQIEQYLKDYYGQSNICWLTGGIEGDDTDGHIDDLARFVDPHTIVFGIEQNKSDANYNVLQKVRKQLDALRDQDGKPFEIVEMPMPKPVVIDGQRCPATYMNFLFINDAILVPTFNDKKNDARALGIYKELLPHHEVIGLRCDQIIWGLGAIHCLTQQIPAAIPRNEKSQRVR
jgi:agmatine deiminase